MPRMAHLKAIQAFEAVARCGNVTSAAEALSVTQSAISYHLRILETDLAVKLFDRGSRGVTLTEAGQRLLPFVRDGLLSIDRGMRAVSAVKSSDVVRVAVLPMFASRWLAPRLSGFWDKFPNTELSFTHDNNAFSEIANSSEVADVAIQWGFGDWLDVDSRILLRAPLVAACSPELLERLPLRTLADLANHSLLHVDNHEMWRRWLKCAGADETLADKGLLMSDRHFQLSATLSGVGISLFIRSFVQNELDKGTLVCPLGLEYETGYAYYLVRAKYPEHRLGATRFYDWIVNLAAIHDADPPAGVAAGRPAPSAGAN